jgi:hypothetical protein
MNICITIIILYDKVRQTLYLTRNYLFYVQTLHTSLYSQHVSAAMRHHPVKPNTTHQITSRYQTVIQFKIKSKHIYKTIGYETKLSLLALPCHRNEPQQRVAGYS